MAKFVGKWKLLLTENFDEYLKAAGVPFLIRKMICASKADQEIELNGDVMVVRTLSTLRTMEVTFTFGKEFEETLPDGQKSQSLVVLESDTKMVHTQKTSKQEFRNVREVFPDDTYEFTMETNGVVAKRTYKRIN